MLYRSLRAMGHVIRPCNYTERLPGQKINNKEYGQSALAKMMGFGIVSEDPEGNIVDVVEPLAGVPYGLFRMPRAGQGLLRLERQLRTLRVDDEKQQQDEAMTLVQLCWHLWSFYASSTRGTIRPFDIRAPRTRIRRVMTRAR